MAVVAVNLAAGRALVAYDDFLFYGLALMGLALSFAGCRLFRTRGPSRAFWAGFLLFGLAVSSSFAWVFGIVSSVHSSSLYRTPVPPMLAMVDSAWWSYLYSYLRAYDYVSNRLGWDLRSYGANVTLFDAMTAWYFFLPQLLIASFGGLLFRQIARWRAPRPVHVPPAPIP